MRNPGRLPEAPGAKPRGDAMPVLDLAIFTEARDVMKDRFGKAVACYLEDAAAYIQEIREALDGDNAAAIVPPAHTVKSSSRQIGAMRLAERAMDIELAGRNIVEGGGSPDALPSKFERLEATFEETRKVLEANAPQAPASPLHNRA